MSDPFEDRRRDLLDLLPPSAARPAGGDPPADEPLAHECAGLADIPDAAPRAGEPHREQDGRIQLLVIVIWFGGMPGLLSNRLESYESWSWVGLSLFIALACMFLLGCSAFASVTEHAYSRSMGHIWKSCTALLVGGAFAANSLDRGDAAFLMFLLSGFALSWCCATLKAASSAIREVGDGRSQRRGHH